MCVSTPVLRTKAEGATTRQLAKRPGAAVMVTKKQGSYLHSADEVRMHVFPSWSFPASAEASPLYSVVLASDTVPGFCAESRFVVGATL